MIGRSDVLREARLFLGTPYRHQGARRGVGCDCLGLIRGVWRALYGRWPQEPGPYAVDWAQTGGGQDRLMLAAERHLDALGLGEAQPGDVVLFRWRANRPAQHCGILEEGGRVIHAYEGAAVVSSPLTPGWQGRIAGVFRFPER